MPYYQLTTSDNNNVLAFPLLRADGTPNNFTGATATLILTPNFTTNSYTRSLTWNPTALSSAGSPQPRWEYKVVAGEFAVDRYTVTIAVIFPNSNNQPQNSKTGLLDIVLPE